MSSARAPLTSCHRTCSTQEIAYFDSPTAPHGPRIRAHSSPASRRSTFFFFSSRRRHTRCSREWSSDVCSSDLVEPPYAPLKQRLAVFGERKEKSGPRSGMSGACDRVIVEAHPKVQRQTRVDGQLVANKPGDRKSVV